LDGGPANRRALLDRLLFHVEPDYLRVLKAYSRALQHRNASLRAKSSRAQINAWDEQLGITAGQIDRWRSECLITINKYLLDSPLSEALGALELEYRRGWLAESDFAELLRKNRRRDVDSGTTSIGPHRAELRIKIRAKPAKTVVSRGQGKLIISAIIGAQARYLRENASEQPILLVDDLASELDRDARLAAVESLMDTGAQLFFTAIESTDLPHYLSERARMFHVEQGVVRTN
jgi:DNA replication and repair protein RecF